MLYWPLCVIILALPSLWLLATQPPWWRDVDGLLQVTSGISHLTVIHWPPLYCLLARSLMRFAGSGAVLSDRGAHAIVLVQHGLLIAAQLGIVGAVSDRWVPRLWTAIFLSVCPVAPCFAHCVGSEALSIISVYALAASTLWLLRSMPGDRWWHWALCFAALFVCLQSRHVNLLYLAIPILAVLAYVFRSSRRGCHGFERGPLLKVMVCCLVVVLMSSAFVQLLCLRSRIDPVPSIGYTFQWRLREIQRQAPDEVEAFAQRIAARLDSDDVETRRAFATWRQSRPVRVADQMFRDLEQAFRLQGRQDAYVESHRRLNNLFRLVVLPPDPIYRQSVTRDFWLGLVRSPGSMAEVPIRSTEILFDWLVSGSREVAAQTLSPLRSLQAFSGSSKAALVPAPWTPLALWLGVWRLIPLTVWLAAALATVLRASRVRTRSRASSLFWFVALVFLGLGLLVWLANCMLTFPGERFVIPLWQSTQIALIISVNAIVAVPRQLSHD